MKVQHYIQLVARPWSERAAAWLAPALFDPDRYSLADLESAIAAGRASLFHAKVNGAEVGAAVVFRDGAELVVQAIGGRFGSLAAMMRFDALLCGMAEREGCRTIRGHVRRAGLVREYLRHGYEVAELVVRKIVH